MPLYEFECPKCGAKDERVISLANFDTMKDTQKCDCGAKMKKLISTPMVIGTDTQLFLSKSDDGFGNDNAGRQAAKKKAAAAGVPTAGKTFVPGLCRRKVPYDPSAWVSDKAEVVAKAEKLGRCVEGSISHHTPVRDKDYARIEAPYRVSKETIMPEVQLDNRRKYGGKATKQQIDNLIQEKIEIHSGNG